MGNQVFSMSSFVYFSSHFSAELVPRGIKLPGHIPQRLSTGIHGNPLSLFHVNSVQCAVSEWSNESWNVQMERSVRLQSHPRGLKIVVTRSSHLRS